MPRQPSDFKLLALQMYDAGLTRREIRKRLGVSTSLLACWLRRGEGARIDRAEHRVGDVRKALDMMEGRPEDGVRPIPLRETTAKTRITRQTLRRWRDEPRFRNATYEYDPAFEYDPNDLLDRATIAADLCKTSDSVGERFDIMLAAIDGFQPDLKTTPITKEHTPGYWEQPLGVRVSPRRHTQFRSGGDA